MGGCEEEKGHVQAQVLDEQGGWMRSETGWGGLGSHSDVSLGKLPSFPGSIISHFVQTSLLQGLIGQGTCRAAWLSVCLCQGQHVDTLCVAMASYPLLLYGDVRRGTGAG